MQKLLRLEGKDVEAGQSEVDSLELQSLKKLKTDLLAFLLQKEAHLADVNRET